MASYLEKILVREPENPYLPADGTLAAMRAAGMSGYIPAEYTHPNLNPMLGYTRQNMDGYRPNTVDSQVPKGRQPGNGPDLTGYDELFRENPWDRASGAASELAGVDRNFGSRSARLEEIDRKIADLKNRISSRYGDIGDPVSRYRFVYENDASGYQNAVQGDRSHRQAKELADINHRNALELQKASQEKTDRQQAIDAWKQNSIDLDAARYSVAAAENAYRQAVESNDTDAIRKAGLELQRARGIYNRNLRENEALRGKVGQFMGFFDKGQPADQKIGLDDTMTRDVQNAESFTRDKGEVERIDSKPDNVAVPKTQKKAYIESTTMKLDYFENKVKNSTLSQKQKNDLLDLVAQKRKELAEYAKSKGKGGQGTIQTASDYENAVAGKSRGEIRGKGVAWLKAAKKAGANIADIDAIINEATKLGYK